MPDQPVIVAATRRTVPAEAVSRTRKGIPMAHHLAAWLGIPAGVIVVAMFALRKVGMALRDRRRQARDASRPAYGQRPLGE